MSNEKTKIRQFRKKDKKKLCLAIDDIFDKEDALRAKKDIIFETTLKKDHIKDDWTYWVSETNGKIAGFIGIVNSNVGSPWIAWFGVAKKYRGKGIGKRLLERLIKETKRMGAKYICVEGSALPMFKVANGLYRKYGFKEIFRLNDYWCKGDHVIVMRKKL